MNLLGILTFPARLLRALDQLTDEVRALRAAVESAEASVPAKATAVRRTTKEPDPEPALDLMLPGMLA